MEKKDINLVLSYGAIEPPKKIIKKRLGYVKYFSYIYKVNERIRPTWIFT
jgi:hypothetical protein